MDYHKFDNVSDLAECYDNSLSALLDHHSPIKKRVLTLRPAAPWYNDQITQKKQEEGNSSVCGVKSSL